MSLLDEDSGLKIFGIPELTALFSEMSEDVQKNIINTGFRKASKTILDQAKSNLSSLKHPTKFQKKLGVKPVQDELSMYVGEKKGGAGSLAHLIESGTKNRLYKTTSKSGLFRKTIKGQHSTGAVKATNFFEKALDSTETQVNNDISDYITDAFLNLIDKYESKKKT